MNDFWAFCAGYGLGSLIVDIITLIFKFVWLH